MTNPFEDSAEAAVDIGQFNEWLEQTAEREGTSTDELLGQLVSTYWILSELTELVDESPYDTLSAQTAAEEGSSTSAETTEDDEAGSRSELVDVVQSIAEMHSKPEPQQQSSQAIDSSVLELIRSMNQGGSGGGNQGMSYRDVRAMVDDVKSVEEDVSGLRQEVSGRLDSLESTVDDLGGTVEQNTSVIQELTAEGTERSNRLDAIESRFESSYDDVREILSHLLDETDEHDAKLDTIVDAYDDDVTAIKHRQRRQVDLAELKTDAARRDLSRATCEHCDNAFNIALLGEPACPHCDREITEFAKQSGSFGRKRTVARVRRNKSDRSDVDLAERIRRVTETVTEQAADSTEQDLPDWWEPASEK